MYYAFLSKVMWENLFLSLLLMQNDMHFPISFYVIFLGKGLTRIYSLEPLLEVEKRIIKISLCWRKLELTKGVLVYETLILKKQEWIKPIFLNRNYFNKY